MDIEGYIVERADLKKIGPGKRQSAVEGGSQIKVRSNSENETEYEESSRSTLASLTEMKSFEHQNSGSQEFKRGFSSPPIDEEETQQDQQQNPSSGYSYEEEIEEANISRHISYLYDEMKEAEQNFQKGHCWNHCLFLNYDMEKLADELDYSTEGKLNKA